MIHGRQIIVFGEDFDRHPHCLEHLVRHLLPENEVLWVQTIGMRSPNFSLYDLKRVVEKLGQWFRLGKKQKQRPLPINITVISPIMIPYNQFGAVRWLNRKWVVAKVRRSMKKLGFRKPVLMTCIPSSSDFVGSFQESFSIYYCVDEFSLWPGIDAKLVRPMEEQLLKKVDLVLTTSKSLLEDRKPKHPRVELLSHGVDLEHFRLKGAPKGNRKKVGFFGLIDERVDLHLLFGLARRLSGVEFHFIGDVVVDVSSLSQQTNIVWHGKIPYPELPKAIQDVSVFILPYHVNALTRYINPLKIKEYLATGRPVVATELVELELFKDHLFLAKNREDFFRLLEAILERPEENTRPDLCLD